MANTVTSLSVVFLSYNEEHNVAACILEATAVLEQMAIPKWEILIIDDGSRDQTALVADGFSRKDARIRTVSHSTNKGYGEAMRTGLNEARCEWVFITDGDLQFHLEDLSTLCARTSNADAPAFVQGYRLERADSRSRVWLGSTYQRLVRALFRLRVRDAECSFRLIRKSLLQKITLRSRGDLVPAELLYRAERVGAVPVEIGVRHRARAHGESKAITVKALTRLGFELGAFLFLR